MKTGHFYFGKNRTFLNWYDTLAFWGCGFEKEGIDLSD